jgi:hypothetical protein
VVALIALLGLIFFVSRSCQQSQVKVSQSEALATAKAQVDFNPTDSGIRLLRQGLSTKPFWIVVLYTRNDDDDLVPRAQVHIDAKTGEVTQVTKAKIPGKEKRAGP